MTVDLTDSKPAVTDVQDPHPPPSNQPLENFQELRAHNMKERFVRFAELIKVI